MKLLVFAHTPPPHHGQSYMVKLMLDGLGGDVRSGGTPRGDIACYHVNARLSDSIEDIGEVRFGKAFLVLRYCAEAIWCRVRHGVDAFYYVPAPAKRAALYRDWIVMLLCRPFFRRFIHHWHAVGLGDWLAREGQWWERALTRWLLGRPRLGLALAIPSMRDALWFDSQHVELVPNGIPDPCPDFAEKVAPQRRARLAARERVLRGDASAADDDARTFRVLYLAHCTREKGVFEALDGVALANRTLAERGSPFRIALDVAGQFVSDAERAEFEARVAQPDLAGVVRKHGFVGGDEKRALYEQSDCFCFPSHHESFGLVLAEAMAFALPIVTAHAGAIPELLPPGYRGVVPPRDPAAVASALLAAMTEDATPLRARFEMNYTAQQHLTALRRALATA